MGGWTSLLCHEADASPLAERRRVGRRQVGRDEHERLLTLRHPRHVDLEDLGDDPVAHVTDVRRALRHATAECREALLVRQAGLPHGTGGTAPLRTDQRGRLGDQLGIGGEQPRRIEDRPRLPRGLRGARPQLVRHRHGRPFDRRHFGIALLHRDDGVRIGFGDGRREVHDGGRNPTGAHPASAQHGAGGDRDRGILDSGGAFGGGSRGGCGRCRVGSLAEPVVEQRGQPLRHGGGLRPSHRQFDLIALPRTEDEETREARRRRIGSVGKSSQPHLRPCGRLGDQGGGACVEPLRIAHPHTTNERLACVLDRGGRRSIR